MGEPVSKLWWALREGLKLLVGLALIVVVWRDSSPTMRLVILVAVPVA